MITSPFMTTSAIPTSSFANTKPSTIKILNLSQYNLNPYEVSLLEKGLSYCPTTNRLDDFLIFIDLNTFMRKLTLTRHFSIESSKIPAESTSLSNHISEPSLPVSSSPPSICSNLKPKSNFYPLHHTGNYIETFYSLVSAEFRNINSHPGLSKKQNLTQKEQLSIVWSKMIKSLLGMQIKVEVRSYKIELTTLMKLTTSC